jgi:Disintegrin/Metallo-peptidase family M12B Reprolysin-like
MSSANCNSQNQFLMNPTSSASEQVFSPCTIGNICKLWSNIPNRLTRLVGSLMQGSSLDTSCIKAPDANQRTFSLQMCGNGIVETGEECDPGAGSNSTCCDPATCRFRENAVCDPLSSSCCTSSCQFAPAAQVCRPARDATCDVAETCTGLSADCPADQTSPNGRCGGPPMSLFLIFFLR